VVLKQILTGMMARRGREDGHEWGIWEGSEMGGVR
jgi:hypothetical protein